MPKIGKEAKFVQPKSKSVEKVAPAKAFMKPPSHGVDKNREKAHQEMCKSGLIRTK